MAEWAKSPMKPKKKKKNSAFHRFILSNLECEDRHIIYLFYLVLKMILLSKKITTKHLDSGLRFLERKTPSYCGITQGLALFQIEENPLPNNG